MKEKINSVTSWEDLAQVLREELQERAWLLRLLESLQRGILSRDLEEVTGLNASIAAQADCVAKLRNRREAAQGDFFVTRGVDRAARLESSLNAFPATARPLFSALISEGTSLITRLRRRTEQNDRLLRRACEVNRELLEVLQPERTMSNTYNQRGKLGAYKSGPSGNYVHTAV